MSDPLPVDTSLSGDAHALLHKALLTAERRAATLAELSRALATVRDPLALAQRAVELVAHATGAVGAFVYLWDPLRERLVLRAATDGLSREFVDSIALRMGEGVIGWAALMRRQAVINEGLQEDPRFLVYPGVGDTEYRSMLVTPIRVAGGVVVGVFVLHAHVEHAFAVDDANLVDEVATLVASGIDQAETVQELRRASTAARFLLGFPREAFASRAAFARELVQRVPALVPTDVCVVELLAEDDLDEPMGVAVAIRAKATDDGERAASHRTQIVDRQALEALLERHVAGCQTLVQTLRLGASPPLGVLTLYAQHQFSAAERAVVEVIGTQAGTALAAASREGGTSTLAALRDGDDDARGLRLLRRLGWRRTRSVPVVVRVTGAGGAQLLAAEERLQRLVQNVFEPAGAYAIPGAGTVRGLLMPLAPGDVHLPSAVAAALREAAVPGVAVGIGRVLDGPAPPIGDAFRDAWRAALWAEVANVFLLVHHDEIADLQALSVIAQCVAPALRELVDEFAAVGTRDAITGRGELLATVDVYLAHRGSIEHAASRLFVHRNTVRRRLKRVEEITGRPVDDYGDWLTAALAVRLVRARPSGASSSWSLEGSNR